MLTKVSPGIETITGRKNLLINGNFDVWQRGNGPFPIATTGIYTADRFFAARSISIGSYTVTQVTGDMGKYAIKLQRDQGDTDTDFLSLTYALETNDCIPLRGKNLVAKVRLKKGADFIASNDLRVTLSQTSADDLTFVRASHGSIVGSDPDFIVSSDGVIPTTDFVDYEVNLGLIASTTNTITFRIGWNPSAAAGAAGVDDSITVDRVQLEVGNASTNFEDSSYADTLELCQRYYQTTDDVTMSVRDPDDGLDLVWSQLRVVNMRITPTESYSISAGKTNNNPNPTANRIQIKVKATSLSQRSVMGYTADAEI